MTFLEWLLTELIGEPPTIQRGDGESEWDCPQCGHPRFHTMPDKPDYRHRARCWRCDFRGDAADMLRWFRPIEGETYPQLCERREVFRRRYEEEMHQPAGYSHRGPGAKPPHVCIQCQMRDAAYDPRVDEFSPVADAAIRDLLGYLHEDDLQEELQQDAMLEMLRLAAEALLICARHNLHPLSFAGRCHAVVWFRESEAQHLAECSDPHCEAACCRRSRGWTEEEIRADIERMLRERAEQVRANGNGRVRRG